MTLKEFVRTLWLGRWLICAALVVGLVAGSAHLMTREVPYFSTATVQFRLDAPTTADVTPPSVTIDPMEVTAHAVAAEAARILVTAEDPSVLAQAVEASHDPVTGRVAIGAEAPTSKRSAEIATAFAQAYITHVGAQWGGVLATLEQNMANARAKVTALQTVTGANPGDPIALADLDAVLSSYKTLAAQQNIGFALGSPVSLVQAASGGTPVGMGRESVIALALLAGGLLGLGLALLRRGLDSSVSNARLARTHSGAPVLAELADVRRSAHAFETAGQLPVDGRSATPFTESIRELRTAIQATQEGPRLTIVVSATEPDAPRSFIAANLAASWALSGRDTIVMSGDLRRGDLEPLLPPPPGWTGSGRHADDGTHGLAALRPTHIDGLRFLPAPATRLDPADFLASTIARQLIDEVRAAAEIVIIDAPPVLAAADAIILGGYTDGVVLIATVGHTDRSILEDAATRLDGANVELLGVALHGHTADRRMTYASTYASEPLPGPERAPESSSADGRDHDAEADDPHDQDQAPLPARSHASA